RTAQAQALADWVDTLKAVDPDVVVLGDFNAYEEEDPLALLRGRGLVPLLSGHHTYVYMGLSGALDHAYATPSLSAQVRGALAWAINAEEPRVLDYTLANKPDDRFAPDPYRSSDHNPLLLRLELAPDRPPCAGEGARVVINGLRFQRPVRGPGPGERPYVQHRVGPDRLEANPLRQGHGQQAPGLPVRPGVGQHN
ncbi:MAG: endonuclease/exonuclease/phosphatase family protein, partial [Meiothermus sp.]|uniref:endonuclease/exonuclease/phosphatase family protein n=1 Tax=Meiothermus sp. TaxID=1955249 RepID=UPI0025DD774D